jgi:hypothetical protein
VRSEEYRKELTKRFRKSREKSPEESLPFLSSGIVDRNGNADTLKGTMIHGSS